MQFYEKNPIETVPKDPSAEFKMSMCTLVVPVCANMVIVGKYKPLLNPSEVVVKTSAKI